MGFKSRICCSLLAPAALAEVGFVGFGAGLPGLDWQRSHPSQSLYVSLSISPSAQTNRGSESLSFETTTTLEGLNATEATNWSPSEEGNMINLTLHFLSSIHYTEPIFAYISGRGYGKRHCRDLFLLR